MVVGRKAGLVVSLLILLSMLTPAAVYAIVYETKLQNNTQTIKNKPNYYVNQLSNVDSSADKGTHSNFENEKATDGIYDTLTEIGTKYYNYYPSTYNLLGSTTYISGSIGDLASDNNVYMQFGSYPSANQTTTFGQTSVGGSSLDASGYARGTIYTCTTAGSAQSISAYLSYTQQSGSLGYTSTSTSTADIENYIKGNRIQTPAYAVTISTITAYIECTFASKNMKAAIYTDAGVFVAGTAEQSIPSGTGAVWRTFTFSSPPTLAASTYYTIVVWSASGSGSAYLRWAIASGVLRQSAVITYGSWPSSVSFTDTSNNQYCIYCSYQSVAPRAQCAIYSADGSTRLGVTDEVTLSNPAGSWVTFSFSGTRPDLSASTQYILAIMADSSSVSLYYTTSTATFYRTAATYPNWPSTITSYTTGSISIYCTVQYPTEYTAEIEFTGSSNTLAWIQLDWKVDSAWTTGSITVALQLYNYQTGQYPTSGDGYLFYTSSSTANTDETKTSIITTNPTYFRDGSGTWKLKIKGVKTTSSQFSCKVDLCECKSTNIGAEVIAKIGIDTSGSNTYEQLPLSFSHTLVAGSNRMVVVCYGSEHSGITVTGVTYGGVAMTLAVSRETPATGTKYLGQIWYILEANLPAAGSKTVSVTQTGTATGLSAWACAMEYTGVGQGAPEATDSVTQTSGNTITNTISPSTGAWVISAVGCGNAGTYTHSSPQVEIFDVSQQSTVTHSVAELQVANGQTSLSSTFSGTVNRQVRVCASWLPATNYQLDLEEQWIGVDFHETNEYLCIKTGSLGSETLKVDVWGGSSWTTVIAALQPNQWNNVTVSSYLTSSTFTIRFKGGTETSDSVQNSWNIDATLLHVWS